jgi:hypothetical protein
MILSHGVLQAVLGREADARDILSVAHQGAAVSAEMDRVLLIPI